MARKRHKPEEIVGKRRQVEVLVGQGKPVAEAIRAIGVTEPTDYRWRAGYGGLKLDQVRRLKHLEQENGRLRRVVSDLTLEKLILKEAASETTERRASSRCRGSCHGSAGRLAAPCLQGAGPARCWTSAGPRSARPCASPTTKRR